MDIRSGALPASVYFLVGHNSDYSTYPTFTVQASVSDSDTYDVYVDGTKQSSAVTSATAASLSWSELALQTGFDVTYPAALRTHIVRVTPTSTGKLTAIKVTAGGVLWAHFTTGSAISLNTFCANISTLESCTCNANSLLVSELSEAFAGCSNLVNVPPFDFNGINAYWGTYGAFYDCRKLQKVTIKNVTSGYFVNVFENCRLLKEITLENCNVTVKYRTFLNCFALKKLPSGIQYANPLESPIESCSSLQDTFIDLGYLTSVDRIPFQGSSSHRVDGLKGIIVSPEATLDSQISPQLDVSYTGLSRAALVNLFKSMPYNVGYNVVGAPTINSGVVSGFSTSDYLTLSQNPTYVATDTFEWNVKFTTGSGILQNSWLLALDAAGSVRGIYYTSGSVIYIQLTSTIYGEISGYTLQPETTYIVNILKGNGTLVSTLKDANGTVLKQQTKSIGDVAFTATVSKIGQAFFGYFNGSIDLNGSYMKLNGVTWFRGTAAMTKTVSVVGCPGTADLTTADKAIAEDKGWAITLS